MANVNIMGTFTLEEGTPKRAPLSAHYANTRESLPHSLSIAAIVRWLTLLADL